jgi:hypothetical protein
MKTGKTQQKWIISCQRTFHCLSRRITIGVDTPRLLFSTQIVEKTIGNQNNEHGARVNNLDKAAELRGLRLLGPDVIVRRAREFLTDNLVYYNLLTRNCEHFATMCRYEEGFSLQVRDFCTARVRPNLSKFSSYLLRKLSCSQVDAMSEVVERVHQQD